MTPASHHESIPAGEAHAIRRVVSLVLDTMRSDYASRSPVLRGQHPKSHGCVRAEVEVGPDVPRDLRYGVFATPRTYAAWVRFSASAAPPRPDGRRDAHGMSIQLLDVDGEHLPDGVRRVGTQDFTLVNHSVFFCRDAIDYAEFAAAVAPRGTMLHGLEAKVRTWAFYLPPVPANWRVRDALTLRETLRKDVTNPLYVRYWSQTPHALGPHAVKYSAIPRDVLARRRSALPRDDGLQQAMVRTLRTRDVVFDLAVQRQIDPDTMPVEDATVEWRESQSPFRKVATVRVPRQEFTSHERRREAEALVFSPWNSLTAHRPLGGINRMRRAVYAEASRLRHDRNGVRTRSPA